MSNPSTVWSQLALPNPANGAMPFVASDAASIIIDVVNFFYSAGLTTFSSSICTAQLTVAGGVRQSYSDTTAVPGAATINKPAGRVKLAAGQTSLVVTSSYAFLTSIINAQVEGAAFDATATRMQITPANGSFTITFNAAATAAVTISFDILNVF